MADKSQNWTLFLLDGDVSYARGMETMWDIFGDQVRRRQQELCRQSALRFWGCKLGCRGCQHPWCRNSEVILGPVGRAF